MGREPKAMTLVYYTQVKNGKTYPKQKGEKKLVFVNDVYRKDGRVHTKYVGIREAPEDAEIEERIGK